MAELPPNEKAMAPQLATNPRGEEVPLQLATKREGPTAAPDNDRFITRDVIIQRAETWTDHPVPYSMDDYKDGYRTDCSGYVSMAWNLNLSQTTWMLVDVAPAIRLAKMTCNLVTC